MNYVVTFTDRNCINNILKVWLPTLWKNFSGKIVVITFDVDKKDIEELKKQNIIVIEEDKHISGLHNTIKKRLKVEEKFINSLEDNDKIMLIDGADVVFQSEINSFFEEINEKIFYSTTGTLSNKTTIKWLRRLLKRAPSEDYKFIMEQLPKTEIMASGMLAGKKISLLEYFKKHKKIVTKFQSKNYPGINQAVLTYLILKYPNNFEQTDIHNCRVLDKNIIVENGIYKIKKTIPIIHFSCPKMKSIYKEVYLDSAKKYD